MPSTVGDATAPRTTKGEATRERLLESASQLFAEQGYDATSVESIAGGAGIAVSGVYRHFATKEALLLAVAQRANHASAARRALGAGGDLSTQIAELFAEYLAPDHAVRRRLSIELSRAAINNERIRDGLSSYNRSLRASLERTIQDTNPDWRAAPDETTLLAHLLLVLLMGAIHLDTLDAERIGDPLLIEHLEQRLRTVLAAAEGAAPVQGRGGRPPRSASRELDEAEPTDGRKRRAARTRRRILDAAGELFALHGYDGTTTEMIAARAEITVPGLYLHVDSKEALLAEVGRHTFARYRLVGPLGDAGQVVTDLSDLVSAFSRRSDRTGRRLAIELDFGAWRSDQLAEVLRDFHRQVRHNVARSLLAEGIHADAERADLAALIVLILFMGIAHVDTVDPELVGNDAWSDFLQRRVPQLIS